MDKIEVKKEWLKHIKKEIEIDKQRLKKLENIELRLKNLKKFKSKELYKIAREIKEV